MRGALMQAKELGPTVPAETVEVPAEAFAAGHVNDAEFPVQPRARGKCALCKGDHDSPDVRFHCSSYMKIEDGKPAPIALCTMSIADGRDFNRSGRLVHVAVSETSQRNSRRVRVCCEPKIAPWVVPAPDATPDGSSTPPHAPSNPAPAEVQTAEASS
jgi:hypothetical protein